jgi:cytochrome c556
MPRNRLIPALTICTGLLIAMPSYAADEEENHAADYRHEVMETMGANTAALVKVLTGRVDVPEHLQVHADTLAQTATLIGALFAPGSEGGHALPIAWDEPEKLAEAADSAAAATAALAAAVTSGDRGAVMKAFRAVGDSCKGCHERYKEEEEEHDH